ncbi:MAG: hypothetical protein PSV13_14305 [Lacunisphaera sp.]|nr:hypothetical protein [Lacunisphaera sp.]
MKRPTLWCFLLPALAGLALAGCGPAPSSGGHEHAEHGEEAHAGEEGPVKFKEGVGLQLPAATIAALGLQTNAVEERAVQPTYQVTASVFDAGPPARASALVPAELADSLERHPPAEARLLAVHRELSAALAQVEVVFALPGNPAVGSTVSLTLRRPATTGPAVPASALLRTATGTFVYVVNGTSFLRTAVKPGAGDADSIQILDGLHAGDLVVTAGAEQLWLTELRLTKGGGHSH